MTEQRHGITANGVYSVTEKMLQAIELREGVLLDELRSRPAPASDASTTRCCESCKNIPCKPLNRIPCFYHLENPCIENGCTDIENCDEICEHSRIFSPAWVKQHDATIRRVISAVKVNKNE